MKGQTAQSPLFAYEPLATVSTFAGSSNGYTDGSGINAQFLIRYSLAADGTLYVSDSFNAKKFGKLLRTDK